MLDSYFHFFFNKTGQPLRIVSCQNLMKAKKMCKNGRIMNFPSVSQQTPCKPLRFPSPLGIVSNTPCHRGNAQTASLSRCFPRHQEAFETSCPAPPEFEARLFRFQSGSCLPPAGRRFHCRLETMASASSQSKPRSPAPSRFRFASTRPNPPSPVPVVSTISRARKER